MKNKGILVWRKAVMAHIDTLFNDVIKVVIQNWCEIQEAGQVISATKS